MQRQMGAKTSGNFWHIILGHGHCGGVGAQRIEIIILILIIILIIILNNKHILTNTNINISNIINNNKDIEKLRVPDPN